MQAKKLISVSLSLSITVTAIAAGASFFLVKSIRNKQTAISAVQQEMDQRYETRRHLSTIAKNIDAFRGRFGNISLWAVREGHELEFITTLENLAETNGVKQDLSIEMVNQKELSPWEKTAPFKLSIEGDYASVIRHLSSLDSLPYLMSMSSLTMTGSSSDPRQGSTNSTWASSGNVRVEVNGNFYLLTPGAPVFTSKTATP